MDLNKLVEWAKEKQFSLYINFWESDGTYEIEVSSNAPSENYYEKRAISAELFMEHWEERGKQDEALS
jgi:hypothetical protein